MNDPKRLKQTHLFSNAPTPCVVPVNATVYSWTFVPPFNHALKGCSYFGQTLQPLEARTCHHKSVSLKKPKELGLHALWMQYPYDDHWHIQVVETRRFVDRIDACNWMDAEEKRLISEHGGVLCNMEKDLKQTLNLTKGGQGNPRLVWDGLVARSRRQLTKIWPKFRIHKNFLQYTDFAMWLWCACFRMRMTDNTKNRSCWEQVFSAFT